MNGSQFCIAAYVVGLVLLLGYAAMVWYGCVRARRRRPEPGPPVQIVVTARRPISGRTA